PTPTKSAPPATDVRQEAERLVKAGARGAVVHLLDGDRTHSAAAGISADDEPMRTGHRFRIASITKTFTSALTLQLVREGRLALGARVTDVLPGVVSTDATVADLLRHTSGLPDYLRDPTFTGVLNKDDAHLDHWPPRKIIAYADRASAPGGYAYSNTGYLVLGLVLEKVTGRTYGELVRERITRPLGLRDTELPATLEPAGLAASAEGTQRLSASIFWSAGGLVSTTADVAAFYRALFGGRLREGEAMRLGVVESRDGGAGYGVFTRRLDCGVRVFTHTGLIIGYSGSVMASEDGRRVAVVQLNSGMAGDADRSAAALMCS
ncbi:beta-lactamase family protein, partial [Nonomuraea sp. NN258]|uniref:serine hydrolase domain-containing protein n=1 Tax=Nonomuraea antri TaxID=2730852 RepID=UPI00156831BB